MSTSFGENEISLSSFIIGKAIVRSFHAAQAIFPRLMMTLGISLHDVSEETNSPIKAPYQMIDMSGELRLKEMQDIVAPLFWTGERHFVRATKRGHEAQVQLSCDLDFQRVELIERWREGKPPTFWLQLWPTLMANGEKLDWPQCRAFEVKVPREAWRDFYAQVGGGRFDIIEIQFSAKEAEQFRAAVSQVQKAREQIAEGDYDGSVLTCRKSIEQIFNDLPESEAHDTPGSEPKTSQLREFFTKSTDSNRAAKYAGILSNVKQLTNLVAHGIGTKNMFSREEAQFVLRTTEALLALIGRLSSR